MKHQHVVRLGISTCPNDTFAFHAILQGNVRLKDARFDIALLDVQELNERLFRGEFDIAKASFSAALQLSDRYGVLRSGSALGFGVGPLLLAAEHDTDPRTLNGSFETLCPGQHTTATLLYRLFYPHCGQVRQVVFSDIMSKLEAKEAAFGVCIHEGRFTFAERRLSCVADLGVLWEKETGEPLPLGGILYRTDLDMHLVSEVQNAIHESIQYGLCHREETLVSMRQYAQEFTDDVLFAHVDLYVNDWTLDLGDSGEKALRTLQNRAIEAGVIDADQPKLTVMNTSTLRGNQ